MSIISEEQSYNLQSGISVTAPSIVQEGELNTAVNYYFDVISEHSIEMINQITDNYVENNTAIQDHIAQNPLIISISGISGEKVFRYDPAVANQLLAEAQFQAAKMGNSIKRSIKWLIKNNKDLDKVKKYEQEADKYNASQIQVLGGLEAVRKRPGMYIGPLGGPGFLNMLREVFQNALDQLVSAKSPCDLIYVVYDTSGPVGKVTISDMVWAYRLRISIVYIRLRIRRRTSLSRKAITLLD